MPEKLPLPSLSPPEPDQVEINVFGPGLGECILVHLGSGAWMMIDSCKRPGRAARAAALEHIATIGQSPDQIEMIVATHWHDDHVKGISEVYRAAEHADFYLSSALAVDELAAVTRGRPTGGSRFTTGVAELAAVAAIASERGTPIRQVVPGTRLGQWSDRPVSEAWALSPSYEEIARSRENIASLLPTYIPNQRRIPEQPPNDTCIVVLLETTAGQVLLGGDLEHHKTVRVRGWHAVMDLDAAPQGAAAFFKLPHHGSIDAHCPEVWEHRVQENGLAVLTPYERGATPLPRPDDVRRIKTLTKRAYLTSNRRAAAMPRSSAVEKTIAQTTRRYHAHTLLMGHAQARSGPDGWSVALSQEAVAI